MDNYIMLNGKKIPLTDEQVKLIQAEEPKKSPFDRAHHGGTYFSVISNFELNENCECSSHLDDKIFNSSNYCTDKNIMRQHALHMQLNNLLWRYSMTHGGDEMEMGIKKYYIFFNTCSQKLVVSWETDITTLGTIYFKSYDTAIDAINKIVKPFVEGHPDFDVAKM